MIRVFREFEMKQNNLTYQHQHQEANLSRQIDDNVIIEGLLYLKVRPAPEKAAW